MNNLKLLLFIAISLFGFLPGRANVDGATVSTLRDKVGQAKNYNDSVKALYNLFDASIRDQKTEAGWTLLNLARHHNLQEVLVDIIPQMSILKLRDPDAQKKLLIEAEFIQDTKKRKAIKTFIEVTRSTNEANYLPAEDRRKVLLEYAKADMIATGDFYQDLLDLYRVVIFIGKFTESNLYLEYLTRLENMIAQLPEDAYYLRNMFYTTAANCHTAKQNYSKALQSDSLLLNVIDDLEEKYQDMGREYRNYDRYKYICYRRMLSNYPALTLEQTRDLYAKCEALAKNDVEVAHDMAISPKALISLLMKEGRHAEAVTNIKKALETEKNLHNSVKSKLRLLGMLVAAADSINDTPTMIASTREYNKLLLKELQNQSEESYNELQVRYEVNNLRNENAQLEIAKRDAEIKTSQKVVSLILGALLVLAVMMMILYRSHFTLRQKARELRAENEKLHRYVETMFHDRKPAGTAELKRRHNPENKS